MSDELKASLREIIIDCFDSFTDGAEYYGGTKKNLRESADKRIDQIEQAFKEAGWHDARIGGKAAAATLKAKYGDDYFSKLAARSRPKIVDDYTDLPVSRQRKWQLRHREQQAEMRRKYRAAKRATGLES